MSDLLTDWLTEEELAAQLKHHERTLARWRVLGIGPRFSRNGRKFIYHRDDLTAWLRAGGVAAPKQSLQRRGAARS